VKNIWHVLARWDDGKERFNIEVTNKGLRSDPDDYYRTGDYALTPEDERDGYFLRSLTPRQELALFLSGRGFRWLDFGIYRESVDAFAWASALFPENLALRQKLISTVNAWADLMDKAVPPAFPPLTFANWPPRKFPEGLPEEMERHIFRLNAI
jgi:hypothetical protein